MKNQSFCDYAVWYQQAIMCAECRDCEFIRNGNIDRSKATATGESIAVLPQAGFVDPEWFSNFGLFRVLILGLNPKGGAELYQDSDDHHLYGTCYQRIVKSQNPEKTVAKETTTIRAMVMGYRPTSSFVMKLKRIIPDLQKKPVAVAYSNQVLCRTVPEADALGARVEPAYRNCFRARMLPLLQTLAPDLIVVMGWRKSGNSWSQLYFGPCFNNAKAVGLISEPYRWLGVQQTSRSINEKLAIERVVTLLRGMDLDSTNKDPMPRIERTKSEPPDPISIVANNKPVANDDERCVIKVIPVGNGRNVLEIYAGETMIGEYERSIDRHVNRKKDEIRAAFQFLIEIFKKHGKFEVRWDDHNKAKSVRVNRNEVATIPKSFW